MNKWMIVVKATVVAVILAGAKFGIHTLNLEFMRLDSLISALISGVIFTIAILLAGSLSPI